VCQDLSVADSPSVAAREIRSTIARRLRDGRSPQEIRDYFVGRFGPSILLTPQGSGVGLAAWLTPGLLFAAGLTLLIGALWRWSRRTPGSLPEETVTHQDRALLDRELEREDIG
jgi:cytochrome c-type biogenesis protein CcmH